MTWGKLPLLGLVVCVLVSAAISQSDTDDQPDVASLTDGSVWHTKKGVSVRVRPGPELSIEWYPHRLGISCAQGNAGFAKGLHPNYAPPTFSALPERVESDGKTIVKLCADVRGDALEAILFWRGTLSVADSISVKTMLARQETLLSIEATIRLANHQIEEQSLALFQPSQGEVPLTHETGEWFRQRTDAQKTILLLTWPADTDTAIGLHLSPTPQPCTSLDLSTSYSFPVWAPESFRVAGGLKEVDGRKTITVCAQVNRRALAATVLSDNEIDAQRTRAMLVAIEKALRAKTERGGKAVGPAVQPAAKPPVPATPSAPAPLSAAAYLARAEELKYRDAWAEALQEYAAAIAADPKSAEAHRARAEAYFFRNRGRPDDDRYGLNVINAIEDLNRAVELDPNDFGSWSKLGEVYESNREYQNALKCYAEQIRLQPTKGYLYTRQGELHMRLNQFEDAIASFSKAIFQGGRFGTPYYLRGLSLLALGRYGEASYDFEEQAKARPDWTDPLVMAYIGKVRGGQAGDSRMLQPCSGQYACALFLGSKTPGEVELGLNYNSTRMRLLRNFYLAEFALMRKDIQEARRLLVAALDRQGDPPEYIEYYLVNAELQRLSANPAARRPSAPPRNK